MMRPNARSATLGPVALAFALLVIAIVSQGVHDIAIEHLGVPFPTIVGRPPWLTPLGDVVRMIFLVLLCRAARAYLDRRSLMAACLIVGAIAACLSETVRPPVIDLFRAEGWNSGGWSFTLTSMIPGAVNGLLRGGLAVVIARFVWRRGLMLAIVAAALCGLAIRLSAAPVVDHLVAVVNARFGIVAPEPIYEPPYDAHMLVVIYLTFLEPTIASFVLARLAFPGLPGGHWSRTGWFTLLVLGASGRVALLLFSTFYVQQPLGLAFLSTGQFVGETAVMTFLTGLLAFFAP